MPVRFVPCPDPDTAERRFREIICRPIDPASFNKILASLETQFQSAVLHCPAPLPEPALIITNEMRRQWEIWLPLATIRHSFYRFFSAVLSAPPLFQTTTFQRALSWGDAFAQFPRAVQQTPDPSRIIRQLLDDQDLCRLFLCQTFVPTRFYGAAPSRYPEQEQFLANCLIPCGKEHLRCLDAACGIGESTYLLASLISQHAAQPSGSTVTGITADPLEIWAAAHGRLPHDPLREQKLQSLMASVLGDRQAPQLTFQTGNLLNDPVKRETFDIILCNGLIGGPILGEETAVGRVIGNLAAMLAPDGLLLIADHFHGGWQNRWGKKKIQSLLTEAGLKIVDVPEGIGGRKGD